jgi:hypothetical protein
MLAGSAGAACLKAAPVDSAPVRLKLGSVFLRGACSTVAQEDPWTYESVASDISAAGVNVVNTLHGGIRNSVKFLDAAGRQGLKVIPSIPLICWVRFGDPPYPETGALGWENIYDWFKLEGCARSDLPAPFHQGPAGKEPLTGEQLREQVSRTIEAFQRSPQAASVLAFYAFDEPVFNAPGVIHRIARVHQAFFQCGRAMGNMPFPAMITGIFFWDAESRKLAKQYVAEVAGSGVPPSALPACLMYDCYLLKGKPGEGLAEYEQYAHDWVEVGKEVNLPVAVVPLGFDVEGRPAENEMRAQAYLALASGCKGVNWFRYETIKTMDPSRWHEVRAVNKELAIVGPTLMRLEKTENIASLSGGGGKRFPSGLVNTFQHIEAGSKYFFLASRDVFEDDLVTVTFKKTGLGYKPAYAKDCLTRSVLHLEDLGQRLCFRVKLPPGGGKLIELGA